MKENDPNPLLAEVKRRVGCTIHGCIGRACDSKAGLFLARRNDQKYALRVCPLEDDPHLLEQLHGEVATLRRLRHPNIVRLAGCSSMTREVLLIAQPLYDLGSVTDVIHGGFLFGIPELAIAMISAQVLEAMDYLFRIRVIHRGIRCSHIFLNSKGPNQIVLSGFRNAIQMMSGGDQLKVIHDFTGLLRRDLLWMAPEALQQDLEGYGPKSDIYSLGITLCEMANGFPPFGDMELMQMLFEKLRGTKPRLLDCRTFAAEENASEESPHVRRRFSTHFHDFTSACLQIPPETRPTPRELLAHGFFKQLKRNKQTLRQLLVGVVPYHEKNMKNNVDFSTDSALRITATDDDLCDFDWDFGGNDIPRIT